VRPVGTFQHSYELRLRDEMVAFAKAVPLVNRFNVTHGDRSWLLRAENFQTTRYGLYDGETRLGGIAAGSWFRRWNGATIDLPDALPLAVQVFLTSVVLFNWAEGSSN
jgi:hypothetical protein